VRRLTTVLTAGGMALVVFVFAAVLMLEAGLRQTLVATGSADNVLAIRKGAATEVQSGVAREQAALIESLPQIARDADGRPRCRRKWWCSTRCPSATMTARHRHAQQRADPRRAADGAGAAAAGDPGAGADVPPGASEIVVGASVARQFAGVEIGQSLSFAQRQWQVVGVFDAGRTAFDSEIWGDAEQLSQAFRRFGYSSVIAQLDAPDSFDALKAAIEADPRLTVEVKRERQFYEDQSRALSNFLACWA
jgi:putative ABC transport system permease protein